MRIPRHVDTMSALVRRSAVRTRVLLALWLLLLVPLAPNAGASDAGLGEPVRPAVFDDGTVGGIQHERWRG